MSATTIHTARTLRAPPVGSLLYGHHGEFLRDKVGFFARTARDYGDMVPLRFGWIRMWLISDPALLGEVLTARAGQFRKDIALRRLKVLLGDGLLTSEGAEHDRRSRLAQPAFRHDEVEKYGDGMVDLTDAVLAGWADGARIDLAAEMSRLTLAIVARMLFGADLLREASALGSALSELLPLLSRRLNRAFPLPLWVPTPENVRFRRALGVLDEAVYRMIAERRAHGDPGRDLLSNLLHAGDGGGQGPNGGLVTTAPEPVRRGAPEQGGPPLLRSGEGPRGIHSAAGSPLPRNGEGAPPPRLTDPQLRDEVMTLFLAGHETTANGLAFTLRLLAKHPEVAARAREEIARATGGRRPTAADVPKLEYVSHVFSEGIRLYPPAWMLGREALEDVVLGGKVAIARGSIVAMSPFIVQRDARWWQDPLAFRPERFAKGAPRQTPFSYFPFGLGKRACIGRSFALLEATLILAALLPRVDLEIDTSREPALEAHITLRPKHGMPAIVRRRDGAPAAAPEPRKGAAAAA